MTVDVRTRTGHTECDASTQTRASVDLLVVWRMHINGRWWWGVNCSGNKHIVYGTLALTAMEMEKSDLLAHVMADLCRFCCFSSDLTGTSPSSLLCR